MQLGRYLLTYDIPIPKFAAAIGVGTSTVYRYLGGARKPSSRRLERIAQVTGGLVQPNDFHEFISAAGEPDEPRT
jgi:transcriptional regulator with XRE-family HTH domain